MPDCPIFSQFSCEHRLWIKKNKLIGCCVDLKKFGQSLFQITAPCLASLLLALLWDSGCLVVTCLCYLAPPTDTPTHPSPSIIHIPRHFRNRRKHALRNRIEQSSYCGRRRATMFQLERIDRCVRRLSPCSHQKTPSIHRRIDGSPALLAPNLYLSPSAAHPVMLISDSVWRSPAATSLSFSFRRSDAWWEWYKVSYLYLSGFGFISLRVICKLTDKSQKHIYKKNYN